jgi:hypothetical protein
VQSNEAHKYKSLEEFYQHLERNSPAADILQMNDPNELVYFPANKVNDTQRIWFFCTDPNYLR